MFLKIEYISGKVRYINMDKVYDVQTFRTNDTNIIDIYFTITKDSYPDYVNDGKLNVGNHYYSNHIELNLIRNTILMPLIHL